jgi:hypothetical protein
MVREHQGTLHEVMVVPGGFSWQEKTYPSLSTIAQAITGISWNGPRFFGLRGGRGTLHEVIVVPGGFSWQDKPFYLHPTFRLDLAAFRLVAFVAAATVFENLRSDHLETRFIFGLRDCLGASLRSSISAEISLPRVVCQMTRYAVQGYNARSLL